MKNSKFYDSGLFSLKNELANRKDVTKDNVVLRNRIPLNFLKELYCSGLISRIIDLKTSPILDNSMVFSKADTDIYFNKFLKYYVKKALRYMVGFGRGAILVRYPQDDLASPFKFKGVEGLILDCFSGEKITVIVENFHLTNKPFLTPDYYMMLGVKVHPSRVIDFKYKEPDLSDLPYYRYGGISETELIYDALISDAIVSKALPNIVERSSTFIYKMNNVRVNLKDQAYRDYIVKQEELRGIFGSVLADSKDEISMVSQNLANLDNIAITPLRKIAVLTGIPINRLLGESPKGLNSTGDSERKIYDDLIVLMRNEFTERPVNQLLSLLRLGSFHFNDNLLLSPSEKLVDEGEAIKNAKLLKEIGIEATDYLISKGIIRKPNTFLQKTVEEAIDDNKGKENKNKDNRKEGGKNNDTDDTVNNSNNNNSNIDINDDENFKNSYKSNKGRKKNKEIKKVSIFNKFGNFFKK